MAFFQKVAAFFMALLAFLSSLLLNTQKKDQWNPDDFELVWADEFYGTELDRTKWQIQNKTMVRRGGYWNTQLARVEDGVLTISAKYLEHGVNPGDPAGWYTARLRTYGLYEQTYGYFEIRCILPEGMGLWSAFWLQNYDGMNQSYPDGSYGSEIDIMESCFYGDTSPNRVQSAVHWGGYGAGHCQVKTVTDELDADIYHTYNTYGLEWNEDSYTFYFNGKKTGSFDKSQLTPSRVPEHILLTMEIGGADGVPGPDWVAGCAEDNGREHTAQFKIDYVRAYQYKEA